MINNNRELASDAAPLSPGGAVADFSAREGTIDDDLALNLDTNNGYIIMVPLVGDEVACPVCEKSEIQLFFMNLTDLGRHLDLHHAGARILWGCRRCEKSFLKLHGARCHLRKCSGPSQTKDEPHKCEACPMSFSTRRGLSTHERHAHPAVRNIKRKEANSSNTRNWTEEEISLLKELDVLYKDDRHPNIEIAKILTTKSVDQIKYKRRKLRMEVEEEVVTEGGCDPVDPGNAPNFDELELESIEEWRRCLRNEIEKDHEVPQPTLQLYHDLKKSWDQFKENKTILAAKIDNFIDTSLSNALIVNNKEGKPPTKSKIIKNTKNTRTQKKRYLYARCQDMFRECPRKLADVVVNDDLAYLAPARQPPEAEEVKKLYTELWGKAGPLDPPIPSNKASGGLIHEYFPPVVAEEISDRIKKIRNKTAGGPDGIEKSNLSIPGLPIVLAVLFNIIYLTCHYPKSWKENRTTLIPKNNKDLSKAENWRPITIG
jgi:hypothetical protein